MTHRFLNWPPFYQAFAQLDSKKRGQRFQTERAVDIVQDAPDGPARALKFYNFVCSIEEEYSARKTSINDGKPDREIISLYLHYHYLLSRNDTTASNALIGTWQKKLGHKSLWEDFNLVYELGPAPLNETPFVRSQPTRASARKSTGCIPASKPGKRPNPFSRRRSAECCYISDSSLTPLSSSDDEDGTSFVINTKRSRVQSPSSSRRVVLDSTTDLRMRYLKDRSLGGIDQDNTSNYPPQETHTGTGDGPPPTPPQSISVLIEPKSSFTPLANDVHGDVDDPMNGTSVSAACLRSERGPAQSMTVSNHPKSLSAPVPPTSPPLRRKRRRRINFQTKKKSSKQKKTESVAETTAEPMAIDTPTGADPEAMPGPTSTESVDQVTVLSKPFIPRAELPEPTSLKISNRLAIPTPLMSSDARTPLSTSRVNVASSRSAPTPSSNPLGDPKGFDDTPAGIIPGFSRPNLPINPPIWAQSRQELCESCDFFKSYQSGVYFSNGYAKGYLLSRFGAKRDIWQDGGRLIISHGGGKAASKFLEADHQTFNDPSVNALVKNWRTKEPLVLISDDKYEHFPFDLTRRPDGGKGYAYVVLGYYFIRHYWAEKHPADNGQGYAVRFKFAFQYCGEGEPWWTELPGFPLKTLPSPKTDGFQNICEIVCFSCGKASPQIYEQGWICLWPGCECHFQLGGIDATTTQLSYTKSFLAARPNPKSKKPAVHIPDPLRESKNNIVTTPLFYHGWHCRDCGRLSCRAKWEHWECASCGKILSVKGRIRDHREFWGLSPNVSFANCDVNPVSGITKIASVRDQLGTFTFILPFNRGKIHLITGSARYNTEADDIFKQYQEHANNGSLPFRRFPMKAHICRGEFLTNYFSQNSGEPYQYVGAADKTLPFNQCPPCVLRVLELIRIRSGMMLGERPAFNELLTAAYMEKQSMGFHTDGERGLGPIVASLSMGSPAIMKFRTLQDRKTVVLSLVLRHGDVLVMEGAMIQAVYEHTVCPIGFRIAVTAREIGSENSTQGAWR